MQTGIIIISNMLFFYHCREMDLKVAVGIKKICERSPLIKLNFKTDIIKRHLQYLSVFINFILFGENSFQTYFHLMIVLVVVRAKAKINMITSYQSFWSLN